MSESRNIELLTAAPKRNREAAQTTLLDNIQKTPRLSTNDSPFKLINLVDRRFDKIMDTMKSLIEESEVRMLKEIDKRFDELKSDLLDINNRVAKIETVTGELEHLKIEVGNLRAQLNRQENSLIASDLRINGIPYMENEDLYGLFKMICETLSITTPAVKSIYRLQNHNNKIDTYSPDAVIMVKLFSPYDKNFVLKSMANFRKTNKTSLLLNNIGIDSDRQFYINENLTSNNFKILQAALRLKKTNKIKSAITIRGLVYIRLNNEDKNFRVDNMDELEKFSQDDK